MGLRKKVEATIKSFFDAYMEDASQNETSIINREVPQTARATFSRENFAKDMAVSKFESTTILHLVVESEALEAAFTSTSDISFKDG
ncbi:hypothetical protein CORC01_02739 [Colletotrichum orchidophilum]|uniref:Uncharacterized protein n=1 Tax=Colletotrichum orchidophilum TaxID=1209926 RepID=A0A1G4BK90_9PEZI|nr:uncharacterized protein CORC01_02739 [Colletotrichum orchidophilum]OHF01861.1 hypothetical protein CORC01_02739 [Colletotrichum orchidophilum]